MSKKLILFISISALCLFLSSGTSYADVIYVDDDASGNNDGTSWVDAYTVIQDAVNVAFPGDQIWVAEGIYTRPTGEDTVLSMQDGVEVYGGFAGTESDLSERGAPPNYPTYLDGESSAYHVVVGASNARLDGFIITGGNASGGGDKNGGGMFNLNVSNLVVINCTFNDNSADQRGGGMYNEASSPDIINCTFSGNSADQRGGGIFNEASSPEINNCIFSTNSAIQRGGGMFNSVSSPSIINCTFSDNGADQRGGAVCNEDSSPDILNSIFWGNTASGGPELSLNYISIPSTLNINYSDVQGGQAFVHIEPGCTLNWGPDMIGEDPVNHNPLFVTGLHGNYYLSHIDTHSVDSPCIDAGSDTAANLGLDNRTTRIDDVKDNGIVDIGFHYPDSTSPGNLMASPPGGAYCPTLLILSCDDPEATIYYTTDGSKPTIGSSVYTGPTYISVDTTLKFMAVDTANNRSDTVTEAYDIDLEAPTGLAASPAGGSHCPITVSLGTSDGTIYYTTDGSIPNTGSAVYAGPIGISWDKTLSFMAVDNCWNQSATVTELYTIDTVANVTVTSPVSGVILIAGDILVSGTADSDITTVMVTTDQGHSESSGVDAGGNWSVVLSEVNTPFVVITAQGTDNCGNSASDSVTAPVEYLPPIWYVNDNATGEGTGFSWTDAFNTIQEALQVAVSGDWIWMAEGTYTSDSTAPVLTMLEGIEVYGGFTGTETFLSERGNPADNPTILDGEDTSYHVVVGASNARLDGFIIKNGNARGIGIISSGGGMYNYSVTDLVVANCTFSGNSAYHGGAGMYNEGSSPTITNCIFSENSSILGGGILNYESSPSIINCVFSDNSVSGTGGGVFNDISSPKIFNCAFSGNSAFSVGGGIRNNRNSSPTIANCTFSENSAGISGGGMFDIETSSEVIDCIFWGDTAPTGPEISLYSSVYPSTLTINNSDVQGGEASVYVDPGCTLNWGNHTIGEDPVKHNPLFVTGPNGDYYLSQPTLTYPSATKSPCVDTGSDTAANLGLDDKTTRIDDVLDSGIVDMGYHYLDTTPPGNLAASPAGGTYCPTSVSLTCDDPEATIYYTLDGTVPTTRSPVYSGPINISVSTTLKFMAVDYSGNQAATVTEIYDIDSEAPTGLSASPIGGIYCETIAVNLTADDGTIYYTTDGSGPTTLSPVYSGPIDISENTILKFIAVDACGNQTATVTETYYIYDEPPTGLTASPAGGSHCPITVSLGASEGTIYYTLDGTGPTTADPVYREPIDIGFDVTLKFMAVNACDNQSATVTELYTIDTDANLNIISPIGGVTLIAGDVLVSGTADTDITTVMVTTDQGHSESAGVNAAGNWSVVLPGVNVPSAVITAQGTDNCGNAASDSVTISIYLPPIWYVNDNAAGNNDGTSWTDAFTVIQDAANVASSGDWIWVAEGTYTSDSIAPVLTMTEGVEIYGGFTGTETFFSDRSDPADNPTILDGEGTAYHVVLGASNALLDGFIVTGGNANGNKAIERSGGGIFNDGLTNLVVTNCTFIANSASRHGGGIYNWDSTPTITNCIFSYNLAAEDGGGMWNHLSSPSITNCIFNGNSANLGGGIYNRNSSPNIINCTFSGNLSNIGGGMYNEASSPVITNCILWDDTAPTSAEIYNDVDSNPIVTYSDVQGGYIGEGNIGDLPEDDPLFVGYPDLHLESDSPCVDTGTATDAPSNDLDGNQRPSGFGYDMGAYEYQFAVANWFVDDNAPPGGDGKSWATAFTVIQYAANVASSGEIIWVAEGIYVSGTTAPVVAMKDGVEIYGGFSGTERYFSERGDPAAHPTVLDGENICYHVVIGASDARLDGFIITDGNASGGGDSRYGGGMFNKDITNLVVANCTFDNNSSDYYGGGMWNQFSSPEITNCTFSNNLSERGGGMYNYKSSPTITDCIFDGNSASYAGGISNEYSSPTITNCTFVGNSAYDAGGIYNYSYSTPNITDCTFSGNSAERFGGGIFNSYPSAMITNCTFSGNSAKLGGGICNIGSSPMITNCTFDTNSAEAGGGIYNIHNPSPIITNCTFSGNHAFGGGGIYNNQSSPDITNCNFSGNSVTGGGGIYNYLSSPTITDCTFSTNSAAGSGGGIYNYVDSSPTITDCVFITNSAQYGGGGIYSIYSTPTITDCTFSTNSAKWGGGMYNYSSSSIISNCTFSENSADGGGGILNSFPSSPIIENCIFSGNSVNIGGGICNTGSSPMINNCTFSNNSAVAYGGGIANSASPTKPKITNCIFSGNWSGYHGGGIYNGHSSLPSITNCTFDGNSADDKGGGLSNYFSSPKITNCAFSGNSATAGSGIFNDSSSPTITDCTFSTNSAAGSGGGLLNYYSSPMLDNCIFSGNLANDNGGGIYNNLSSPTISNCIFSGNSANDNGGGIFNRQYSSSTIINCTFSGNWTQWYGGGICNDLYSSLTITNCILWGDTAPIGPEIAIYRTDYPSTLTISYSDVQGGQASVYVDPGCTLNWGPGMIGEDPVNHNPLFETGPNGDYYLSQPPDQAVISPCVDAGSDTAANLGLDDKTTSTNGDLDTGWVDMGYHYEP